MTPETPDLFGSGHQSDSVIEGGELYAELLQLAVDLGQFGPRLPFSQVTVTTAGPDQVLDLAA